MSLTQYSESQEDQNMKNLLYFTITQEEKRECLCVLWNGGDGEFI